MATDVIDNSGSLPDLEYKVGTWWRQNQKRFSFSFWPTVLTLVLATGLSLLMWLITGLIPWLGGSSSASAAGEEGTIRMTSAPKLVG